MYFVYMHYMYIQFLCVCDLMAAQELKVQYFTIWKLQDKREKLVWDETVHNYN